MKNFLKILVFLFITSAFFISCDGIINNNGNQNSGTNTGGGIRVQRILEIVEVLLEQQKHHHLQLNL